MSHSQLDLTERIAIEAGLCAGNSFKQIAARIHRDPTTVASEVQRNRERIPGHFFLNNDCRYARYCKNTGVCGDPHCDTLCVRCRSYDCRDGCKNYRPYSCSRLDLPPYVCNNCGERRKCFKERYMYSAKLAQSMADERRSDSRKGMHLTEDELALLNEILLAGIEKGQPLAHIYAEHKHELSVGLRSIYRYIDAGQLKVKSIDLRRKVRYRKRKKKEEPKQKKLPKYREGRTYLDFEKFMLDNPNCSVIQMDTVKGKREKGPALLTMLLLKYDILLIFLLPNLSADSVINVFDFLTDILGLDVFQNLFPVILTDNGGEFKRVEELEYTVFGEQRCMLFYCDPYASWQKGELEKDHEYIRYVIPKGSDMAQYTEDNIHLLMNTINSVKRPGLNDRCPYEMVPEGDEDMLWLMELMKMDTIAADDVHLKPSLFMK